MRGKPNHTAFIGLGSNEGPREKNITAALGALESTKELDVVKVSGLYETKPVGGPPGQGPFINAVAMVRTTLNPHRLLAVCIGIEQSLGRKRDVRWGPRTIDLDILLFDDMVTSDETLTIPHPLMHERRFVLEPLVEIAPHAMHPALEQSAKELLELLNQGGPDLSATG